MLIRRAFGLKVRDVNFAFKLFKSCLLENIVLVSGGSFIDAELLLEMQREGARFAEIGFDYYPRVAGVSTLASNTVVLKILCEMLTYRLEAYGKTTDNFSGERRRLWLERRDQSRDRVGASQGILRSASLMPNGEAFEDAVGSRASQTPVWALESTCPW